MCACVSLCIQKSKGLWGGGTACALRPLVFLTRDCCVAMETPVERRFYESFSNPLFCPTTWDLFITHTTYKSFHGGEGIQSPVNWSKCLHRWAVHRLNIGLLHQMHQNPMPETKAQKNKKNNSCKKIQSLHKCKEVKEAPCMLKRYLSTAGETEANTATTFSSFFLSVSFSRPWALGNDESVNKCALLYLVSLLTWKWNAVERQRISKLPFSLFFFLCTSIIYQKIKLIMLMLTQLN